MDIRNSETDRLMDGVLTLKTREEAYRFFEDLCTVNEIQSLSQRFEVAGRLRNDEKYHVIADETGASTATISRVNRALRFGENGYNMVLDRLKESGGDEEK